MKTPTLSIITVNFNNNSGLIDTLSSIKQQTFIAYEHIIIDAGSTDGSLRTIEEYAKGNAHVAFWVSEPDKGIYDGMNKGIDHANGEYIYFLNSGDYLFDNNVLASIPFDGTKYICGNLRIMCSDTAHEDVIPPEEVDGLFLVKGFLPHPASFIHHSLFEGQKYRTDYRIVSDWIHMIDNIVLKGCSYKHVNILISNFDHTGLSSTNGSICLTERSKWLEECMPYPIYTSLMELDRYRSSILKDVIPTISNRRLHTQERIKKMVALLLKVLK